MTVVGPALALAMLGDRLGVVRSQDRWAVQVPADAERLARMTSPHRPPYATKPVGREAWSTSFRLDPPKLFEPDRPLQPPGAAVLGALRRPLGVREGRWLSVPAYLLSIALAAALVRPERRPSAVALVALLPFLATGTVFGAPFALPLAGLAACLLGLRARAGRLAGVAGGLAASFEHRAWLVGPADAAPGLERHGWTRAGGWLLIGYTACVALPKVLDPIGAASALRGRSELAPGVGLVNLLMFRGWQDTAWAHALFAGVPVVLLLATWLVLRRQWVLAKTIAGAACLWLLSLFLAREASPEALGIPVALLGLAVLMHEAQPQSDSVRT